MDVRIVCFACAPVVVTATLVACGKGGPVESDHSVANDGAASGGDAGAGGSQAADSFAGFAGDDGPSLTLGPIDAAVEIPPFVDPYGGASGCDGGVEAGPSPCELMMPLDGGLSATLYGALGAANCNWGSRGFGATVHHDSVTTTALITTVTPFVPGQSGSQLPATVEILNTSAAGQSVFWITPPGGCSVHFASNACSPSAGFKDRYVVSGTGTCSQPAQTEADAQATASTTIGDFYFASVIDVSD